MKKLINFVLHNILGGDHYSTCLKNIIRHFGMVFHEYQPAPHEV